jgi:hypothetical protein
LRTEPNAGAPDAGAFAYGFAGVKPVVGDWTGAGHAGVGVFDPNTATFFLRTEVSAGGPDAGQFAFGFGTVLPVAGHYDPVLHLLLAPDGSPPSGAAPLSSDQLQATVTAALARLSAAGVDPGVLSALGSAEFDVGALPAGVLGEADVAGHRVTISPDAAGQGWFVDATPLQDEAFAPGGPGSPLVALPGSPAAGKVDLLTAVLHEMGHLAGRPDVSSAGNPLDLMADALAPGVRRTDGLDQVFAGGLSGLPTAIR